MNKIVHQAAIKTLEDKQDTENLAISLLLCKTPCKTFVGNFCQIKNLQGLDSSINEMYPQVDRRDSLLATSPEKHRKT